MSRSAGNATLLLLMVLAILAFLILKSIATGLYATKLLEQAIYWSKKRSIQEATLINSGANFVPLTTAKFAACKSNPQHSPHGVRIDKKICALWKPKQLEPIAVLSGKYFPFPLIDYWVILNNPAACQQPQPALSRLSPQNRAQSAKSAIAASTCSQHPQDLSNYRTQQNISIDTTHSLGGVLATAGFLEFESVLNVSHKSLIVAGGDVYLRTITAPTNPTELIVLSATGNVEIKEISSNIILRVWAKNDIQLPANVRTGFVEDSRLRQLDFEILGISESSPA